MGKTGLIRHCFQSKEIQKTYYTFFIDIYATKSLREFVFALSKEIIESLKSSGKKNDTDFLGNDEVTASQSDIRLQW